MGLALAQAAADRGHSITLLLGPVMQTPVVHSSVKLLRFRTAADLQTLLNEHWPEDDVLLMAAAVADYRAAGGPAKGKMSRGAESLTLTLEPTPDLLVEMSRITKPEQTIVAFALEPADVLMERATAKLKRKGAHAIVANPLETMDAETITGTLITADGRSESPGPRVGKDEFGAWLLGRVFELHIRRGDGGIHSSNSG